MNNKTILTIGIVLILIGFFKPDFSNLIPQGNPTVNTPAVEVSEPTDPKLKEAALVVSECLKRGGEDRKVDGLNLSQLYTDIALIISFDEENGVAKTTSEIREINSVAGSLMNLKIKGKYPGLASAAKNLVVIAIGDDITTLNQENRAKAVSAFEALAWGCYQGAK